MGDRIDSTFLNNNAKKILGYSSKYKIANYIKDFIKTY